MEGVFVLGADTDVGKTTLCGGLLKMLQGAKKVRYWKPIQTGTIVSDDTSGLREMLDIPSECFLEPLYRFPEPLAPHMAARKWGKTIEIDAIVDAWRAETRKGGAFLVLEGAGGVMVPLNDERLQIDLIQALNLPMLVVAEDRLGAINHTLLALKALYDARTSVLGVVMMRSRGSLGNSEAISKFGKVEILAEFPPYDDPRSQIAQVGGHRRLRQLFNLSPLP